MELQPEWNEFLALLLRHGVRFVMIGGLAVAVHGHARYTKDLDVLVAPGLANARRLGRALAEFGFHATARRWRFMAEPDRMITLGREPVRIDILTSIAGVKFAAVWKRRVHVLAAGTKVPVIARKDLLANKRATGRHQDARDVAILDELTRAAARSRRTRRKPAAVRSRRPGKTRR